MKRSLPQLCHTVEDTASEVPYGHPHANFTPRYEINPVAAISKTHFGCFFAFASQMHQIANPYAVHNFDENGKTVSCVINVPRGRISAAKACIFGYHAYEYDMQVPFIVRFPSEGTYVNGRFYKGDYQPCCVLYNTRQLHFVPHKCAVPLEQPRLLKRRKTAADFQWTKYTHDQIVRLLRDDWKFVEHFVGVVRSHSFFDYNMLADVRSLRLVCRHFAYHPLLRSLLHDMNYTLETRRGNTHFRAGYLEGRSQFKGGKSYSGFKGFVSVVTQSITNFPDLVRIFVNAHAQQAPVLPQLGIFIPDCVPAEEPFYRNQRVNNGMGAFVFDFNVPTDWLLPNRWGTRKLWAFLCRVANLYERAGHGYSPVATYTDLCDKISNVKKTNGFGKAKILLKELENSGYKKIEYAGVDEQQ